MAQRGALTSVKRFAFGEEDALGGTVSVWLDPNAYSDCAYVADYEMLPDQRQRGTRKANHRSHKGQKITQFNFNFKLTEDTDSIYGVLFKAALGTLNANANLAINSGGTNNATTGTISSGVPDPAVKIEYDSGAPDYLPVKTYNGTTITWAIQNRKASRTISAYKNSTQCSGHSYQQSPSANLVSLGLQCDQGSEPNSESYRMYGLVPQTLELQYSPTDRAGFAVAMEGTDWEGPSFSETDIEEQPAFNEEFVGWAWDVHIQSLASPSAPVQVPIVAISGLNLCPSWLKNLAAKGRTSSGTIPGSAISNFKQSIHFEAPVVLTIDIQDTAWVTGFEAETPYCVHLVGYSGDPSDSAGTKVITITFFRAILDKKPVPTDVSGGIVGYQLPFIIEESSDTTHQTACAVCFFNS